MKPIPAPGINSPMLADNMVSQQGNSVLDAAKEHLHTGPVPAWVLPCSFRLDFKAKQAGQVTHLLSSKQLHAENGQTFVHLAIRLETIQAVQEEAQGRIPFEPHTQDFTLHLLKIHRAGAVFDHTSLAHLRCLQREHDGFISPKRLTLMLTLEDVRPGDVLELCYTIQEHPAFMPEYCGCFFALPEGAAMGHFCFSLLFRDGRAFRWKSSALDLQPVQTQQDGDTRWVWSRENFAGSRAEENTPSWHISHPWIQVSDCPDWETVSGAFAGAWKVEEAQAGMGAVTPEIAAGEGGILQQTEKAIQLVQDQYRYISSDGEMDGQAPTAPEEVVRRRYGDCKDLSLLLMVLLQRLGLEARLALVNGALRKTLAGLLPMPTLFDHVVVEYRARGEVRWVDATIKGQGGGSLNRVICDYGVGLPLARAGCDLAPAPEPAVESNVYQIKESVLLDTSGAPSIFGVVVTARGSHAEDLRREFQSQGAENIARRRLQLCVDRFIDVKRVGPMEYRDNRTDNEFFLAEVFEIAHFLKEDATSSWSKLEIAAEDVANLLPLPVSGARHNPFALPHPCQMVHILEVYCVALPPAVLQQRRIESPWLQFNRVRKTLAGFWTVTTSLSTLTDAVPPEGIDQYREAVREIRAQSTWSLLVPAGQTRPHQRSDFGRLPAAWESAPGAFPRPAGTAPAPRTGAPSSPLPSQLPRDETTRGGGVTTDASGPRVEIRYRRKKRHRRRHREKHWDRLWYALFGSLLVVVLLMMAISFFKKASPAIIRPVPLPPEKLQAQP